MRTFVESLKRLYIKEIITDNDLDKRVTDGKISLEELEYIKEH